MNNYYSIYIDKVKQLAETIVIKSSDTAESLNRFVRDYYGASAVNDLYPNTWKYYLNLSGEYHPVDETMYVVSMDTLEKIIFSKENLKIHRATARGYAYGTRQYKELVAQYPKQELLILGILYPVDIDAAIAAPDGKILQYPTELVEENEYSLISKLQDWINGYKIRWTNSQFGISDELYPATSLGIMYLGLVPAILNLRLEACKTNEAHSFHIRQYLASHGMLDTYMDQMTLKQALFFYRNIAYIERNTGQKAIFSWLVEHIMSERNLPLAEYMMKHDVTRQPTEVYPELGFRKNPLNLGYKSDTADTINLQQLLDKEDVLARDNAIYKADTLPVIQTTMENSLSNVLLTKALESSMIDYTDSTPYTMEDTLLAHWLFLSNEGIYTSFIGVTNPISGERFPINVKDAYVFMWYAFCASINIKLDTVPKLYAKHVQRIPTPTVDDLMSIVDPKLVDRSIAEQALSMQPVITPLISTEAFYNKCLEINAAEQMQRNLRAYQEHQARRGMVHAMYSLIYSDTICTVEPDGTHYADWFSERNIKISDFTQNELGLIYLELVKEATGLSLVSTNSLKSLQSAMVRMLSQLSSYTVQFMTEINSSSIKMTDWGMIRVGDQVSSMSGELYLPGEALTVQETAVKQKIAATYDIGSVDILSMSTPVASQSESLDIATKVFAGDVAAVRTVQVFSGGVSAHLVNELDVGDSKIIPVPGIDEYLKLTFAQQQAFKDIYNDTYVSVPNSLPPLSDLIGSTDLDGLDFPAN